MRDRIFFKGFLTIMVFVSFSFMGESNQSKDLKMKVGIFQIPPWQGVVWNEPSTKTKEGVVGGIRGTMTGGNVTGPFPDGIVLFETDSFLNNEDLYKVIKEKVKFPDLTGILPIGNIYFLVDTEKLDAKVINVKFSVQTDENKPDKKKLIDQTFGVPYSRTLLVGFPTNDEGGRGTVYWLAFTIEN